jgi:hypothetical protein
MVNDQPNTHGRARTDEVLRPIAGDILSTLGGIAAAAGKELNKPSTDLSSVLAGVNTLNNTRALQSLSTVAEDRQRDLVQATKEPAVARVVVQTEEGHFKTYYFLRAAPPAGAIADAILASLRSPMGRLASLPIGDTFEFRRGNEAASYEIVEKTTLRPEGGETGWDAINSIFESGQYGPLTVSSLRALLALSTDDAEVDDPLAMLLSEDRTSNLIEEGIRRAILKKMGLRDQPLLNQYQDEVYRLPLETRIALLGPPGTGKTTTLIKRLGLKLDWTHLLTDERQRIQASVAGEAGHAQSWLLFTPTELLKQYVKEAFSRENIPASDYRIQTWDEFRLALARHELRILRTGSSRGGLVLDEAAANLTREAIFNQIGWAQDFWAWRSQDHWAGLTEHAIVLSQSGEPTTSEIGKKLAQIMNQALTEEDKLAGLAAVDENLREIVSRLSHEIEAITRKALSTHLRSDRDLLDKFLAFLATLDVADGPAEDNESDDEEDLQSTPLRGREAAFDAYKEAVRGQARAALNRRQVGPTTRVGRLLTWLDNKTLSVEDALAVGERLQIQTAARIFINAVRHHILGVARQYRRFRREGNTRWYNSDVQSGALMPLEADLLLLTMLRSARKLLMDPRISGNLDHPRNAILRTVKGLFRNHILADEATDFGPLQLGCMAALCDPSVDALMACGDFNQRITTWGTRNQEELQWAIPRLDHREIDISYRHTRELSAFAHKVALLSDPNARPVALPDGMDNAGVAPALGPLLKTPEEQAAWLCARIIEIERRAGDLPSVAILVSREADVIPLANALDQLVKRYNLRAVPCTNGQVVGHDNDIRVFDVQHIKGLEFEAVFFVDLDLLADLHPDLFDKFLYVGTTRAATYLGLTVRSPTLPLRAATLSEQLTDGWR